MTSTALVPRTEPVTVPSGRWRRTAERGAALVTCAGMVFQPILHPAGPGNSSPVDVLTAVTIAAVAVWAASSGRKLGAPYTLGAALLVIGAGIAGLNGPLRGLSLLSIAQDLVLVTWAVAVYNIARRPGVLRMITRTFAYSGIVWATVLVLAALGHVSVIEGLRAAEGNRVSFLLGDPNYAAAYWLVSLMFVYASKTPTSAWWRWYGYLVILWALVLAESNGSVVELVVALAFLVLLACYRRYRLVGTLAVALTGVAVVAGFLWILPLHDIQGWAARSGNSVLVNSLGRSDSSSAQRSTLISESFLLYRTESGLLGAGAHTTKTLFQNLHYPYEKEAHDDYLAALIERGPLGVIGLVLLVASAAWRTGQLLRAPPGTGFARQLPRPLGLVAALIAMGVAGTYHEVEHFRFVWLLLVLVAVLASTPDRDHPDAGSVPAGARGRP